MDAELKEHWENVYTTKSPHEVSWTQISQEVSISLISKLKLPKTAKIIDVGGGDSTLVDELLKLGYLNITVLDISEKALEKAKQRLGELAEKVTWVVSDINEFKTLEVFDLWHDRAVFHFLIVPISQNKYLRLVGASAKNIIIGTFSESGPLKCSGLNVQQYSKENLQLFFKPYFKNKLTRLHKHITPFETTQDFVFGVFEKKLSN